jgi:redox-sensitive bicupin YhaK (pirin superfamily)
MIRNIETTLRNHDVIEGAGVKLKRIFGYPRRGLLDPFLLLDHFGSDDPVDYMAGFPWHPHRGIETVTYMLDGEMEHKDSMGNSGIIKSGDVQWMTAGSGIIHQEMPREYEGRMSGFQLWVNLPRDNKMMEPRYQDIPASEIPTVDWKGINIKVIAGKFNGAEGPVRDIISKPLYLDITVPKNTEQTLEIDNNHTVFVYVFEGSGFFNPKKEKKIKAGTMAKLTEGDQLFIGSGDKPFRFLLLGGKPLNEPIEWRGPIVMNTKVELYKAFEEFHNGQFVKSGKPAI